MGSMPGTRTKEICRKQWNVLHTFQPTLTLVCLYESIYDRTTISPSMPCYLLRKVITNNFDLKFTKL